MLDPKRFRTELDEIATQLARRGFTLETDRICVLEERRKALQVRTQELQNERNTRSRTIGRAKTAGEDIQPLLDAVADLGEQLKTAEAELSEVQGLSLIHI